MSIRICNFAAWIHSDAGSVWTWAVNLEASWKPQAACSFGRHQQHLVPPPCSFCQYPHDHMGNSIRRDFIRVKNYFYWHVHDNDEKCEKSLAILVMMSSPTPWGLDICGGDGWKECRHLHGWEEEQASGELRPGRCSDELKVNSVEEGRNDLR